jgi:exopolysaccharide biosynthesis polyprenyl glycosylphosphotransferase
VKNSYSTIYAFALVVGDFIALLSAFIIAYILRVSWDPRPLINQVSSVEYLKIWFMLTPVWIIIFALLGLYRRNVYEYRLREFLAVITGSILGIMVVITYDFVFKAGIFPARLVPAYGLFIGIFLLIIERTILRWTRTYAWRYNRGVNNVLVIGDSPVAFSLIKYINHTATTGYRVVAICSKNQIEKFKGKHFTDVDQALESIEKLSVNTVLYADISSDNSTVDHALSVAQANHVAFKFVPAHEGILSNNIEVELFQGLPVVSVHQTALTGWGRLAKRLADIILSFFALIVLSPVYLIIAIAIRLSDWGPAIFKQPRLTRYNTTINIYKFRTLNKEYSGLSPEEAFEKMGRPHLSEKYRSNGDYLKNDPRITKIGKFLRKTSLDELPQIFNIFKGNISIVGPRALVPEELENYPFKNLILSVKSGLTGLAQISGRRDISFEERRALDLYYVQNWSFWLDVKILFRTVIDVLHGRGAK